MKGASRSEYVQLAEDDSNNGNFEQPRPQRHRIVPFEISDDPTSNKSGYQSVSDDDDDDDPMGYGSNYVNQNGYQQYQYDENGTQVVGDEYLLGPNYDQYDTDEYQGPPPDNMGTFTLEAGEDYDGEERVVYPRAIPKKSQHDLHPMRICMYFTAFLLFVSLVYAVQTLTQHFTCLGPPFLYITHKGSKNILKFSRDGCLIHEKVLWGVAHEKADLRAMSVGSYAGEEALYVADSADGESGILLYGKCFESTSLRPFLDRVVDFHSNPGANHAYGVAVDELTGNIYASFQDTDVILRFEAETFLPIPMEPGLKPLFLSAKKNKSSTAKSINSKASYTGSMSLRQYIEDDVTASSNSDSDEEDMEGEENTRLLMGTTSSSHSPLDGESNDHHLSQHGRPDIGLGPHHVNHPHTSRRKHRNHLPKKRKTNRANNNNDETLRSPSFRRLDLDSPNEDASNAEAITAGNSHDDKNDNKHSKTNNATNSDNASNNTFSTPTSSPTPEKKEDKKIIETNTNYTFYPGTFVQFGLPEVHSLKERGVRSIIWTKNFTELWIANQDLDSIIIVNRTGNLIGKVSVGKPIGLHYSNNSRPEWVFVGSKGEKNGQVYAVDINSRAIVATYKFIGMKHPTGITSYSDVLFVGDQTRNNVVTFNLTTGRIIKLIIPSKRIEGQIEQLMLSNC